MTKHIADKRSRPSMGKVKAFFEIARRRGETFHVSKPAETSNVQPSTRLVHFLRIERGHYA